MITLINAFEKLLFKCIYHKLIKRKNLVLKKNVVFLGIPIINSHEEANIIIDDNATLNSRNKGNYHINMHSPVKLFAESSNALIKIGANTRVHGTCIHAIKKIIVGKNCLIAANCQIIDSNGHDLSFDNPVNRINTKGDIRPVIIEDNVWICANSFVLPGVHIGEGSVITANSVVAQDIPSHTLAGGNPAKIISRH